MEDEKQKKDDDKNKLSFGRILHFIMSITVEPIMIAQP